MECDAPPQPAAVNETLTDDVAALKKKLTEEVTKEVETFQVHF